MLKTLDRYIIKELLGSFFLGLFILMFILVMQRILKLMELVIDKGVDIMSVGALFLQLLPSFFVITIPMAVMLATAATFNRLSADNEIIALYATGMGFSRIFRPVLIFAVSVALLTLAMGKLAGPSQGALRSAALRMLVERASVGLTPGKFNELFPNMMIYVDEIPSVSKLKGVFIYDSRKADSPAVIVAKEGVLLSDPLSETIALHLRAGSFHQSEPGTDRYQYMQFENYDINIDFSAMMKERNAGAPLSYEALLKKVEETKGEDMRALQALADYYKRYIFALGALIFCITGMPLGIISGKISRVGGFAAGIILIVLYYVLMMAGESLMTSQLASPLFAAAVPIIVLTPLSLYLLKKIASHASPTIFGIASRRL